MSDGAALRGESGAHYRLAPEPEGVGGEALVYRARCEEDGRTVAVKVAQAPRPHGDWLRQQGAWLRRWGADPRTGPSVVSLWDEGTWEDRPYLVLEWAPETLATWGPDQPLAARLAVARALVESVARLQAAGAVHGDLKPGNVAVVDGGEVLLLDPAGPDRPVLTPAFVSPERLAGAPGDLAADRYAVAATTWWLLVGRSVHPPLRAGERRALRDALADRPEGPAVAEALERLLAPAWRRPGLDALRDTLAGRRPPARPAWPWAAAPVALLGLLLYAAAVRAPPPAPPPCPPGFAPAGAACAHPDGRRLVHVPAGAFRAGDPGPEPGDAPPREVHLTRAFWLGEAEVTQAEWAANGGGDPVGTRRQVLGQGLDAPCATWHGHDLRGPDLPVACVDWREAVDWLNALSRRDGLAPAYAVVVDPDGSERVTWDLEADGWRLPTEAEWEWAARGGPTADPGPEPVCARANTRDRSAPERWGGEADCDDGFPVLAPVRSLAPNGLGLYDLQGNVLEWVWDAYGDRPPGRLTDPRGPPVGAWRVMRGGGWNFVPRGPWARYAQPPEEHSFVLGLRVARTVR